MTITVNNEEFLSVEEACEYLGGITRQTLRNRTKAFSISAYKQGISRSVYYKRSDLDSLKVFRPVDPDEDNEEVE